MARSPDPFSSSPSFSLTDEELLIRIHGGDENARAILFHRYHLTRDSRLHAPNMPFLPCLNSWQCQETYFRSLCVACRLYTFGNNTKFSTYFTTILIRDLIRHNQRESVRLESSSLHLDAPLDGKEVDAHEIIPAPSGNEPVRLYEREELRQTIYSLPPDINKKTRRLVSFMDRGYSLAEASRKIGEKPNSTRIWIKKLYEHVHSRRNSSSGEQKKRHPRLENVYSLSKN